MGMTFWQPAMTEPVRKKWWDTKLSRQFGAQGLAATLWVRHFFPWNAPQEDNDRDHIRW
jgi:hypothetical protein